MDETKLQEIKERAEKATDGPWEWRGGKLGNLEVKEAVLWAEYNGKINSTKRDADFIAHARQDIPELVAEIERLREGLDNAAGYISIGESAKANDFICRALGVDTNHYGIYGEEDE